MIGEFTSVLWSFPPASVTCYIRCSVHCCCQLTMKFVALLIVSVTLAGFFALDEAKAAVDTCGCDPADWQCNFLFCIGDMSGSADPGKCEVQKTIPH